MKISLGGSATFATVLNPAVSTLRNMLKIERTRWQAAPPVCSNPARILWAGAGQRTRWDVAASSPLFLLLFTF